MGRVERQPQHRGKTPGIHAEDAKTREKRAKRAQTREILANNSRIVNAAMENVKGRSGKKAVLPDPRMPIDMDASVGAPKQRNVRQNDAVVQQRINIVFQALVNGAVRSQILELAHKINWECNSRTIDEYIERSYTLLKEIDQEFRRCALEKSNARLHSLYISAFDAGNHQAALNVNKEINKQLGIAAQIDLNLKITGSGEDGAVKVQVGGLEAKPYPERVAALHALGGVGPPETGFIVGEAVVLEDVDYDEEEAMPMRGTSALAQPTASPQRGQGVGPTPAEGGTFRI